MTPEPATAVDDEPPALESALKRDRLIVSLGLFAIGATAWLYMIHLARTMEAMGLCGMCIDAAMPQSRAWGPMEFGIMFFMWAEMMVAMMLPSIAPTVLLFATLNRKRRGQSRPYVPAVAFLAGYLIAWTGFSLIATVAQWGLERSALVSMSMEGSSPLFGGAVLLAAGIFQFTPLKGACLNHCRSPLGFLTEYWREGTLGAIAMGIRNGTYCVACCWLLMMLLFVAGVMNLLWVAAITGFVLLERILPGGRWVHRTAGAMLVLSGLVMAGRGIL